MRKLSTLLFLLFPVCSVSIAETNINHAYRVSGDAHVAPVQAFDDGSSLYLQLRDPSRPPAVFTRGGEAVSYTMRPPYMVLPITDKLVLRYGQRQAAVTSASPGRSISVPTQGKEKENTWHGAAIPEQVTGVAKEPTPAGFSPRAKTAASQQPVAPKKVEATGFFTVAATDSPAAIAVSKTTDHNQLMLSVSEPLASERRAALSRIALDGVSVVAGDGTLAGYQRAREVVAHIERVKGARPQFESSGAPNGFVVVKGRGQ